MKKYYAILILLIVIFMAGIGVGTVNADYKVNTSWRASSSGGIDPNTDNSQFAYGENGGWFNFEAANGDVVVTASAVTGFVWAENIGWIHLNPTGGFGGVSNSSGNLTGHAWSENVGWIHFRNVSPPVAGGGGGGTIDGGEPPVVVITAPSDGDVVFDAVTISADVTDDKGFRLVETLVDGKGIGARSFRLLETNFVNIATWNTVNLDVEDGLHTIKVTAIDPAGQEGSSEIRVFVNNGLDLPLEVMAPVEGLFHIDTGTQTLPPDDWSFWQNKTGSSTAGGVIGNANDASAWNINLENDADAGKIVCSVAVGIVAETYAGCENGGGELGQVLIDHDGWWSGYIHLGDISVKPGDSVDEKTQLGVISNTGTETNHLVFMVYAGNNLDGCESNP
ncbi:MAG: peptidoglycan DD-metalloendopeptidase family protein, partial [Candidatus Anammoxibacter sp.]